MGAVKGKVKWFNEGKGSASWNSRAERTFLFTSRPSRRAVSRPWPKARKSRFDVEQGAKGPQALNVEPVR